MAEEDKRRKREKEVFEYAFTYRRPSHLRRVREAGITDSAPLPPWVKAATAWCP